MNFTYFAVVFFLYFHMKSLDNTILNYRIPLEIFSQTSVMKNKVRNFFISQAGTNNTLTASIFYKQRIGH